MKNHLFRRLVLAAGLVASALVAPALAADHTISMSGHGEVRSRPDMVSVTAGVTTNAATAAQALVLMQTSYMQSGAPSNFGYMTILAEQNGTPVLMMRAMYDGTEDDLMQIIAPLLAIPGAGPPPGFPLLGSGTYFDMNTALLETPYDIPQLPSGSAMGWGEDKQAGYIPTTTVLRQTDWQSILDYYLTGSSIPGRILVIEPYGGAINQVPVGANAFVHRDKSMDIFVDVFWDPVAIAGKLEAESWLNGFTNLLANYVDGSVYQNYPRRTITDYTTAYWRRLCDLAAGQEQVRSDELLHFPTGYSARRPECQAAHGDGGGRLPGQADRLCVEKGRTRLEPLSLVTCPATRKRVTAAQPGLRGEKWPAKTWSSGQADCLLWVKSGHSSNNGNFEPLAAGLRSAIA